MSNKTLRTKTIEIAYEERGAGPTVVLLHGFCGSSRYWEDVVPLLEPHVRLIVPDLRGHGASEAPDTDYSMELMADDIAELLQGLGVAKAAVFGHSLGGYVTLAFAERHAGLLSAFGLIHSTAYPDDEQQKENRLKAIRTIRESGIVPFVDGLIPKLFAPDHVKTMADKVETAKRIGYSTSPVGAMRTVAAMRNRPDRHAVLNETDLPVLLVAGEHDQVIAPARTLSVMRDNIVSARIASAGHMSMMEDPERLAEIVLNFLQTAGIITASDPGTKK